MTHTEPHRNAQAGATRREAAQKFFASFFQKRSSCFLALLALASCNNSAPPQTFAPLNYNYLTPIVLKVSSLTISNAYVPTPGQATLLGQDPAPPGPVLISTLNHMLVAGGTSGTGTATITTASVDQQGSNLIGVLTVDIHLVSGDGLRTADTEASVTATAPAPDPNASENDVQAALYGLTQQMMDPSSQKSLIVNLQHQIAVNLPNWVLASATPGTAPLAVTPGAIQATPLTTPPATPGPVPSTLPGSSQTLPGGIPTAIPPAAPQ
jgi:hypothetical protein